MSVLRHIAAREARDHTVAERDEQDAQSAAIFDPTENANIAQQLLKDHYARVEAKLADVIYRKLSESGRIMPGEHLLDLHEPEVLGGGITRYSFPER